MSKMNHDLKAMSENNYTNGQHPLSDLTGKIIKCAIEVYRLLGNGFQKAVYQRALTTEFELRSIPFEQNVERPLYYKGEQVGTRLVDFFVDEKVMVELKAITQLEDVHLTQVINYLEAYNMEVGLLLNFGRESLEYKEVGNKKYKKI